MKLLFCEGSSLSARETLSALAPLGHEIIICDPDPACICRFSRYRVKYYRCPSINSGVEDYYDRITEIIKTEKVDILVPVHEHALLFSKRLDHLKRIVHIELPEFSSYTELFSKIKFMKLLGSLKIPHPETLFCKNKSEIKKKIFYPCFLKKDYGTASMGVWKIRDKAYLNRVLNDTADDGNEFLIQECATGKFETAYSLFSYGTMVSFHSSQRLREGARGSSSIKIGVDRETVRKHFQMIGKKLKWHGPLAIDYFYNEDTGTPYYIDASPRLVEPMNAVINGVNIPEALLHLSTNKENILPISKTGNIKTHMLMMSLLYMAENGSGRLALVIETASSLLKKNDYRESTEELTSFRIDRLSIIPLLFVLTGLLIRPGKAKKISGGTVDNYSLSYDTICKINNL